MLTLIRCQIVLIAMLMYLPCIASDAEYKKASIRFGDIITANDWSIYVDDKPITVPLEAALKNYSDIPILEVEIEGSLRYPLYRGVLNQAGLFEDPSYADALQLQKKQGHRFVRAPVNRFDAIKRAIEYAEEKQLPMEGKVLDRASFSAEPSRNSYRWLIFIRNTKADGGDIIVFYNLLTDKITHTTTY